MHYTDIFFSPHLDDAVLSMGGYIGSSVDSRRNVLVVTLFTRASNRRTKDISSFLKSCGHTSAESLFHKRKQEDIRALRVLGVTDYVHCDFPDGLFRLGTYKRVFGGINITTEYELTSALIAKIKSYKQYVSKKTIIYTPLGVGSHIDHLLVHNAVTNVFNTSCVYWEDIPYASHPEKLYARIAEYTQTLSHYKKNVFYLKAFAFQKKHAVSSYTSQLQSLYENGLTEHNYLYETYYKHTKTG